MFGEQAVFICCTEFSPGALRTFVAIAVRRCFQWSPRQRCDSTATPDGRKCNNHDLDMESTANKNNILYAYLASVATKITLPCF